uniref:G domain-containing protein n=1 Tax=Amphimedon queenslandica TaxID=400682 RepID=A0A1X7UB81_AMPQE
MADCEGQRITICVTGTKGSGKSTLIKSLLEGQAKIISTGDVIATALATASVKYEGKFWGIPASFYNIRAPSNIVSNKLLVKNVEALNLFDTSTLVLFCVKMSNRPCNDEIEEEIEISIKWLNKHLGQEQTLHILRKTIFVLTFADAEGFITLPGSSRSVATNVTILMTKCMTKRMMECSFCFEDCLKKQDIPNEIINKMPVCAAGKGSEVKLPLTETSNTIEILSIQPILGWYQVSISAIPEWRILSIVLIPKNTVSPTSNLNN